MKILSATDDGWLTIEFEDCELAALARYSVELDMTISQAFNKIIRDAIERYEANEDPQECGDVRSPDQS